MKNDSGMTHVIDQTVNKVPNILFVDNKLSGLGRFGYPWDIDEFTKPNTISYKKKIERGRFIGERFLSLF
ncbi:hypothetical protein NST63_13535 [Heyndrickxia sp. FSL W8-0496]|uniref:hypothetical protein n=1 Tax=Heyndrickxia TaxID=2837504 RepID=UPI0030F98D9D